MKKKTVLFIVLGIILVQFILAFFVIKLQPDMSQIGTPPHKMHEFMGIEIPLGGVNIATITMTWTVMLLLLLLVIGVARSCKDVPGRWQSFLELLLQGFDQMCKDTLGKKGRLFMPYVLTLFLFILLCNYIGLLPPIPVPFTDHIIIFEEPTRDLNTTLGLGIIAFLVSHIAAIRYKGIKKYVAEYFEPMFEIKGVKIPNVPFMPLNVIGEFGKLVSHSFRLYGNILGGAIILQVVSSLIRYVLLPPFLIGFFGLFVGAVQAFVFAMLALTYIAVLVEE